MILVSCLRKVSWAQDQEDIFLFPPRNFVVSFTFRPSIHLELAYGVCVGKICLHTHTDIHAHAHTDTQPTPPTHTPTHPHTDTHTQTHNPTRTHAHQHAHAHAHTHPPHTHAHTRTQQIYINTSFHNTNYFEDHPLQSSALELSK